MDEWIVFNGNLYPPKMALLPVIEEGILYGIGLFETIRIEEGIPLFLKEHLGRLYKSAQKIDLTPSLRAEELREDLFSLLDKTNLQLGSLRLNLIPNHSFIIPREGISYQKEDYERGFQAIILSRRRLKAGLLPSLKSFNYLENILGKREALSKGAEEGIFLNEEGYLTEGSISNLFFLSQGEWVTPSLEEGLLPGITRTLILEIFRLKEIRYKEAKGLIREDLYQAQEAFLTNSLMEIMPLISCDGRKIGEGYPGSKTKHLYRDYLIMKEGRKHDSSH